MGRGILRLQLSGSLEFPPLLVGPVDAPIGLAELEMTKSVPRGQGDGSLQMRNRFLGAAFFHQKVPEIYVWLLARPRAPLLPGDGLAIGVEGLGYLRFGLED